MSLDEHCCFRCGGNHPTYSCVHSCVPQTPPPGIDSTLTERGERYGLFEHQARITQDLKRAMHRAQNWPKLSDDMKESLEMVASKIARILNGDPNYDDNWHDIVGYARLIEKRLKPQEQK